MEMRLWKEEDRSCMRWGTAPSCPGETGRRDPGSKAGGKLTAERVGGWVWNEWNR